jgi:hypothetical protein
MMLFQQEKGKGPVDIFLKINHNARLIEEELRYERIHTSDDIDIAESSGLAKLLVRFPVVASRPISLISQTWEKSPNIRWHTYVL